MYNVITEVSPAHHIAQQKCYRYQRGDGFYSGHRRLELRLGLLELVYSELFFNVLFLQSYCNVSDGVIDPKHGTVVQSG